MLSPLLLTILLTATSLLLVQGFELQQHLPHSSLRLCSGVERYQNRFSAGSPKIHPTTTALGTSTKGDETDANVTLETSTNKVEDEDEDDGDVDWDWQQVAKDVFEGDDQRPIVLFDGVCNLCNDGINFAMDQDESAKLRFCSLRSKVAQSLLLREGKPVNNTEIGFITKKKGYFSSNAVSHICMELDSAPIQWFGKLGQVTPGWIREGLFQFVSENRNQFGENDSCRLDFDGTYTSRFVSDPIDDSSDKSMY